MKMTIVTNKGYILTEDSQYSSFQMKLPNSNHTVVAAFMHPSSCNHTYTAVERLSGGDYQAECTKCGHRP